MRLYKRLIDLNSILAQNLALNAGNEINVCFARYISPRHHHPVASTLAVDLVGDVTEAQALETSSISSRNSWP